MVNLLNIEQVEFIYSQLLRPSPTSLKLFGKLVVFLSEPRRFMFWLNHGVLVSNIFAFNIAQVIGPLVLREKIPVRKQYKSLSLSQILSKNVY